MMSVSQAQSIVEQAISPGPTATLPLEACLGRVVAEDIFSKLDSPRFDNASMDGFALGANSTVSKQFQVVGGVAAGSCPTRPLKSDEAMRITTGAMVPEGTSAVIPEEDVVVIDADRIQISREVKAGECIRKKGEEITAGGKVLAVGTPLKPGTIGYLASLGVLRVPVFLPPRVAIVPTGSELVERLEDLGPGKIIDSNAFCLRAALQELYIVPEVFPSVPDQKDKIFSVLQTASEKNDFVIVTGGVSVGEFDLVKEVLTRLGFQTLFWQVAQKPGKPLYFGRRNHQFVFGLPGNPASGLVCFYEYVRMALLRSMGYLPYRLAEEEARLLSPLQKKGDRLNFVRGRAHKRGDGLWVQFSSAQESHKMLGFAEANCLAIVPLEVTAMGAGDPITIHWLPPSL